MLSIGDTDDKGYADVALQEFAHADMRKIYDRLSVVLIKEYPEIKTGVVVDALLRLAVSLVHGQKSSARAFMQLAHGHSTVTFGLHSTIAATKHLYQVMIDEGLDIGHIGEVPKA